MEMSSIILQDDRRIILIWQAFQAECQIKKHKSSETKHFKALMLAQKEDFELPSRKNRLVNVVKYRQIWLRNKHFALKSFDVI